MTANRLFLLIYQIITTTAGLLGWPFFYRHLRSRGRGESFLYRLGLKLPPAPPAGVPRVWLHGVSVGEILAATPLVAELQQSLPGASLLVSTGTETGQAMARRHLDPLGVQVCYFPLDIPWAVSRYLRRLRPQMFISLESEIWPSFLTQAHRRGVQLVLANARLSDQTFRRLIKYRRFIIDIINYYDVIAAGSLQDYRRLAALGLPPAKLYCTGNLKYDRLLQGRDPEQVGHFRRLLAGSEPPEAPSPCLFFLAASTHPGEEEIILEAYESLRAVYPALRLLLAPRHPERAPELGGLLKRCALPYQLWSGLLSGQETARRSVVLIDTIGDLFSLYGLADIAFVGGSLVPHGGQNILEPAAWGVVPLHGPHLDNFRWAQAILQVAGADLLVTDAASLIKTAHELLGDPATSRRLGAQAQAALAAHQGAARRQAALIATLWRGQQPNLKLTVPEATSGLV